MSADENAQKTQQGPPAPHKSFPQQLILTSRNQKNITDERTFRQQQRLFSGRPWTARLRNTQILATTTHADSEDWDEDIGGGGDESDVTNIDAGKSIQYLNSDHSGDGFDAGSPTNLAKEEGESSTINRAKQQAELTPPQHRFRTKFSTTRTSGTKNMESDPGASGLEEIELNENVASTSQFEETGGKHSHHFNETERLEHFWRFRRSRKASQRLTSSLDLGLEQMPENGIDLGSDFSVLKFDDFKRSQVKRQSSIQLPMREHRIQIPSEQAAAKDSSSQEHHIHFLEVPETSDFDPNPSPSSSNFLSVPSLLQFPPGHPTPSPLIPAILVSRPSTPKPEPASSARGHSPFENGGPTLGLAAGKNTGEIGPNLTLMANISKSISKFKNRNRITDVSAIEQANFMNKFGMGTAPSGEIPHRTDEAEAERRLSPLKYLLKELTFNENESYFYYWVALVSLAYVYNLLVVIARAVFTDLLVGRLWILWLVFDLIADGIYMCDIFVRTRTGYLEQGLLVRDHKKIRTLYFKSHQFVVDLASMLPIEYFASFVLRKQFPALRLNRLLKRERIQRFMEQTETRSSMPNAFRVSVVVWYIAVIIHWNACFYFMISEGIGLGSDGWVYGTQNKQSLPDGINDTLTRRYIYSFYWSTLILTTIGEVPGPQRDEEYVFVTIDLMCGVLIFATIVGNVGSMISNMSAGRTDFQNRIDNIKQYMAVRGVGKQLENRVIKWFDYLWANKQSLTDQQVLRVLPDKLQAEIAMHVHFETLRKVRIFQDCEAGLLAELVLKLQLQVFSPGDYVCRKGDIGREMYIVKRGMLQVVADDGLKVFATLSEGAVFGELSILNIAGSKNGNRRTANVRSVGYTDLFVLNKNDLWTALREYPEARKILINKGRELLRKDNLLDENAPEENRTVEEFTDELQSSIRVLQTRIARLTAEHINTETKLRERITYLECKLKKCTSFPKNRREKHSREEDISNEKSRFLAKSDTET